MDITNPVDTSTFEGLAVPAGSSASEELQKFTGAKVVKAFNTTFAGTLTGGQVAGQQLDVLLIAGDDEMAVKAVSDFAAAGGLNPIVVGPQVPPRRLKPGEQKPGPPLRSSSGPHEVGHVCDQSRRPRLHLFEFQWRDALKQPRAGAER